MNVISIYFYPMKLLRGFLLLTILLPIISFSQSKDTVVRVGENYVTLSEIVVNQNLDVASFIKRVKEDTTFYKAFKNLRIVGFRSINDIRMLGKKGNIEASLKSKTIQVVKNHCRQMEVLEQNTTGDFYDSGNNYHYYTASMYAQLFFTKGKICGENNIVGTTELNTDGLSGIEKHKAQLKILFFNPGKKIKGLPFISNKTEIFSKSMAGNYDMKIDFDDDAHTYIFSVVAKEGKDDNVVIRNMTTSFDASTFEVLGRNYTLKYDAGVYDFNVRMNVKMTRVGKLLVPSLITYNGNWKVMFKKRERGLFTATLSDFKE